MSVVLSVILGSVCLLRAAFSPSSTVEIVAIVISCIIIVIVSVLAGACLPLCLQRVGIDPAHASTTIQVIMDISGVAITMVVTTALLDSNFVSSMFKAFFLTENVDGMTHSG